MKARITDAQREAGRKVGQKTGRSFMARVDRRQALDAYRKCIAICTRRPELKPHMNFAKYTKLIREGKIEAADEVCAEFLKYVYKLNNPEWQSASRKNRLIPPPTSPTKS